MILRCGAVLFDLDGVLVDSTACVEEAWRRWAADHGLDALHAATFRIAALDMLEVISEPNAAPIELRVPPI